MTDAAAELAPGLTLRFARLDALSARELHDMLKLRFDVFVLEQQSLYPEIDGRDTGALHGLVNGADGLAATLRILGIDGDGPVWIGRIAVAKPARGAGLGRKLIAATVAILDEAAPGRPQRLGAQRHLQDYYAGFGFAPCSAVYDDGGIPHVDMERTA